MSDRRSVHTGLCLLLVVVLGSGGAVAKEWRLKRGFEAALNHTDNADPFDGLDAGETVASISPFVELNREGKRTEIALNAKVDMRRFAEQDQVEIEPDARLSTRTDVVERLLSVATVARVSQRAVGGSSIDPDDLSLGAERAAVYSIGVSPVLTKSVGQQGRLTATARLARTRSGNEMLSGSDRAGFGSNYRTAFARQQYVLLSNAEVDVLSLESGGTSRSAVVEAGIGYRFRPTLFGFGSAGRDWLNVAGVDERAGGSVWSVGLRWKPIERVAVRIGYSRRAFGDKPTAGISIAGRRSTLSFHWSRNVIFARDVGVVDLDSLTGDSVSGASGAETASGAPSSDTTSANLGDSSVDFDSPLGRDASSVDERVDLSYGLRGRRSLLTLSAALIERQDQDTHNTSRRREHGVSFVRQLNRRAELVAGWRAIAFSPGKSRDFSNENRYRLMFRYSL